MKNIFEKYINKKITMTLLTTYIILCGLVFVFTYSRGIIYYDVWDYTEGLLWAKATLRAKSIIDPEFAYYYILPFGSNLLMAPFVALLGPTLLANQLGMCVYYLILVAFLFKLSRSLFEEINKQLLFLTTSLLFIFTYVGDNVLHHLLNYGIGYLALIIELSCVIDIIKNQKFKKNIIILALSSLWAASNGLPSMALASVPTICGILVYFFSHDWKKHKRLLLILLLTILLSSLIGLAVFKYYESIAIQTHNHAYNMTFDSLNEIANNIFHDLFVDLFTLFSISPQGQNFFSISGIFSIIKIGFLLSFIIVFYLELRKEDKSSLENMFFISNIVVVLICLFEYIFGQFSVNRYLFNAILSLFLIDGYFIASNDNKFKITVIILEFFFLIALSSKCVLSIKASNTYLGFVNDIVEVVKEKNIKIGYTYKDNYYGKQVDVFTGDKYETFMLNYNPETKKFYVIIDRNYEYQREKPNEKQFYIIIPHENMKNNDEIVELLYKYCIDDIDINDVKMFIYDINNWDNIFEIKQLLIGG